MTDAAEPAPTRAEELRDLAREYLRDTELSTYCTNIGKVRTLASRLGNDENWNAFATTVKIVFKDNPDNLVLPTLETLKAFLGDTKKAVAKALKKAAKEPGAMAAVTSIEQMLESESPPMVCAGLLLRQRRGRIWFDTFLNKIMTDWKCDSTDVVVAAYAVGDDSMRKVMMWMISQNVEVLGHVTMRTVTEAVFYVAELDQRDTLHDHVKSVPQWDRVERLDYIMTLGFGAEIDANIGQTAPYLKAVGRNWMVSLCARAMQPGAKVDCMPVLIGKQGLLKSSAMRVIGGPFFREISESPANKDFYVDLQGCWVGEIAELASIASSKVEVAKVKAMLSRVNDHFRPPYGRVSKDHLRRTVFAGTGNLAGWMRDESGGRRFWPVICGAQVDLDWLTENRDQLIAEAMCLYEDDEPWWIVPQADHALAVERQQSVSVYEETIRHHLSGEGLYDGTAGGPAADPPDAAAPLGTLARWGNVVTQLRVIVQWLRLPHEHAARHNGEVTAALVRLGWKTTVTSARMANGKWKPVRCWIPADSLHREALRVANELSVITYDEETNPF